MTSTSGDDATLGGDDASVPSGTSGTSAFGLRVAQGDSVGRYVVLAELGAGAMGVVYSAYDPDLDRKVAVKLLRPDNATGPRARARMLREAQALARLSHPNVVAIHDVGSRGDDVYIAMEFVAGQTLGAWLREQPRGWREILRVVEPVAHGLAAAHEAGLVHRDIKPDNVMIANDGRVRVMDFGLALGTVGDRTDVPEDEPDASASKRPASLSVRLTRQGVLTGTPAYMAPEQFADGVTDGRCDQFSFCVMLYEALLGERPFAGDTPLALATAVIEGHRRQGPSGIRIPRWLRRVVDRGLSRDPAARWPSMTALLDGIGRGRAGARLGRVAAGAGMLVALAGAAWGGQVLTEQRRVAECERLGDEIAEVYGDDVETRLREAFVAADASFGAVTADRVAPWLREHAGAWRGARTEVCMRATVRASWDADLHERAVQCLAQHRDELRMLLETLVTADAPVLVQAVQSAVALRPVDPCLDVHALQLQLAPPEQTRAAAEALRAELGRARIRQLTGTDGPDPEAARERLARAEALGWAPLSAMARVQLGSQLEARGEYAASEATLTDAYFEAAEAEAHEVAFQAAIELAFAVGVRDRRMGDGVQWTRHAALMRVRMSDPLGTREATTLSKLATIHAAAGDMPRAIELYEQALAILDRTFGPDHPLAVPSLSNLARALQVSRDFAAADRAYERALKVTEAALGPDHPTTAALLDHRGQLELERGHPQDAEALVARALAIRERVFGPDHPTVAVSLQGLGNLRRTRGAYDEALAPLQRALDILERALGPDHPQLIVVLVQLAYVHAGREAFSDARPYAERALTIAETGGVAPLELGDARLVLARVLDHQGVDPSRARTLALAARDAYREAAVDEGIESVDAWLADHPATP
jgi:tetratricopeptide (TPR) repeat protein/predicted Ser/Thr protein kinase